MTTSTLTIRLLRLSRRCLGSMVLLPVLFGMHPGVAGAAKPSDYIHMRSNKLALADSLTLSPDFPGFTVPDRSKEELLALTTPLKTYTVDSTAYTSSVEECDSDPFITADGSTTRDGIIAANFLPFGTKVRIPSLFGDKIFEVHDRMNARYWYRIDVWMEKKADMRQYGIHRNVKIEIVEMGNGKTQWKKLAKTK